MKRIYGIFLLLVFTTAHGADKSVKDQPHVAIGCGEQFYALNKIDDINARLAAQNGKVIYAEKFFKLTKITLTNTGEPIENPTVISVEGIDEKTNTIVTANFLPEPNTKIQVAGKVQVQLTQAGQLLKQETLTPCTDTLDQ